MRRTGNVQEEAMKLIRFVNLTSVVFIDMISSLSAQTSCWRARGAGMGQLKDILTLLRSLGMPLQTKSVATRFSADLLKN